MIPLNGRPQSIRSVNNQQEDRLNAMSKPFWRKGLQNGSGELLESQQAHRENRIIKLPEIPTI